MDSLLDKKFIDSLEAIVKDIIAMNETKKAETLVKQLVKAQEKYKSKLVAAGEIKKFYNKIIIKLRFIALPLLAKEDVFDLLGRYFTWQFHISDYNIGDKLEAKLITVTEDERDKIKERLRNILLQSREVIIGGSIRKHINDWLKDYTAKVGLAPADTLKKQQYLIELTKDKTLAAHDLEKLKILFDFYEKLKLSSFTPLGLEETVPIVLGGKLYVFNRGQLEEIKESSNLVDIERLTRMINKPESERQNINRAKADNSSLENLQQLVSQYPVGSLERRAVEEEIKKITN